MSSTDKTSGVATVGKVIEAINPTVAIWKAGFEQGEGIINGVSKLVDSFKGLEIEKSKNANKTELEKKFYDCVSKTKMKLSSNDLRKHLSDNELKKHISDNQKEVLIKMMESDKFNEKSFIKFLKVCREPSSGRKAVSWTPPSSDADEE